MSMKNAPRDYQSIYEPDDEGLDAYKGRNIALQVIIDGHSETIKDQADAIRNLRVDLKAHLTNTLKLQTYAGCKTDTYARLEKQMKATRKMLRKY